MKVEAVTGTEMERKLFKWTERREKKKHQERGINKQD